MGVSIALSLQNAGQNIGENTTNLDVTLTAFWAYGTYNHMSPAGTVTVDGRAYPFNAGFNSNRTASGSDVIFRRTVPVRHDPDGTKTVTVTADYWRDTHDSKVMTLPRIPRASTLSVPDGDLGSPVALQITAPSADFTHTLRYRLADRSGVIGTGLKAGEHRWNAPLSLAEALPEAVSGLCTYTLETYAAGTLVGSFTAQARLRVPESVGLTLHEGWLSLEPVTELRSKAALWGYIQGLSRVKGTVHREYITHEGAYGARVQSLRFRLEGRDYGEPLLTQVLEQSGTQILRASVTDSRGRSQTRDFPLSVLPYAAPRLSDVQIFRCNAWGEADPGGYYVSVRATALVSSLDGQNSAVLTASVRQAQGDYGPESTLQSGIPGILGAGRLLPTQTYELRLRLTDRLGSTVTVTETIPTKRVFFHGRPGGLGAAFGKYAEADGLLDVDWDLRVRGKPLLDYAYPVGSVYLTALDHDPQTLFGGSWRALSSPNLSPLHLWQRTT